MFNYFSNSPENIRSDLSRDIICTVDRILGNDNFENEKLELFNSILFLFCQQEKEIENSFLSNRNNNIFLPNTSSNAINPYLNIYFLNQPPTTNLIPYNLYNQQQNPQNISLNPYFYNNFQAQFQSPINPQQPCHTSIFSYPNYSMMTSKLKTSKIHKKSDKKSKHKHHKSKDKNKKDTKSTIETFPYEFNSEFTGIINHLTKKTGGNIHDNGTIELTSNSVYNSASHQPKVLLGSDSQYAARIGDKNAWVCFDFKKMKIEISYYSLKAGTSCSMQN